MKTAISIPDPVFDAAEDLANRLGMSRSQLYTTAIKRYLDAYQDETVTRTLNEVYAESTDTTDPILMKMQMLSFPAEDW